MNLRGFVKIIPLFSLPTNTTMLLSELPPTKPRAAWLLPVQPAAPPGCWPQLAAAVACYCRTPKEGGRGKWGER